MELCQDIIDQFKDIFDQEQETRAERVGREVCRRLGVEPPTDKYALWPSLDIRDADHREFAIEIICDEIRRHDSTLSSTSFYKWISKEQGYQRAASKIGLENLTEDQIKSYVIGYMDRMLFRLGDEKQFNAWASGLLRDDSLESTKADYIDSCASITFMPRNIERWMTQSSAWQVSVASAIKHYLNGVAVDATLEIVNKCEMAKQGLDLYFTAMDSESMAYFGRVFEGRAFAFTSSSGGDYGVRKMRAFRKILEDMTTDINQLKAIRRRDVYSGERALVLEFLHGNYKSFRNMHPSSVRELCRLSCVKNPPEDKTIDRVFALAKDQFSAIKRIERHFGDLMSMRNQHC